MNDPTYRQIQIEHTKYSYALDLQVRQARLMHDMKVQHDQADQLRVNQFNRLEMQNHYSGLNEVIQQLTTGALSVSSAAAKIAETANRQAFNAGGEGRSQKVGLAEVAAEGLDVLRRLTGGFAERQRDRPVDALFGADGIGSDDGELDRAIQQKTKAVREEIDRLRKESAGEKAASTQTVESTFLAEIRAMRAELAKLQAQVAKPGDSTPAPTPPTAEQPTAVPGSPATSPEQPKNAEPVSVALVKSRPKGQRKASSRPVKKSKQKPRRLGGKK